PEMLQVVDWPRANVAAGVFGDVKALDSRVAKVSLLRGEPVLEARLSPVGTTGGLSAVINEGKRAITVRVNEIVGVAGFALPGNLVDILINMQDDANKPVSKIVLEQILVLAVAQQVTQDQTKPQVVNAVTLEVTPEQAEKIDLARSVGTLSLVLRNQVDKTPAVTSGARKKDMLKNEAEPDRQAGQGAAAKTEVKKVIVYRDRTTAPPVKSKVEVIRGTQKTSTELEGETK
ncbi:MAG: Flp pilus assembly protein CpaB, partial [Rhodocyclaceae bacterium]|nr:Flp pilus assembly protein CpaB [Rhodocyclaceae bacterium]